MAREYIRWRVKQSRDGVYKSKWEMRNGQEGEGVQKNPEGKGRAEGRRYS